LGGGSADEIDAELHVERLAARRETALDALPDGAFVLRDGRPQLVLGAALLDWSPAGYTRRSPQAADARAELITPPSLVEVLRAGWEPDVPFLHPTARIARP
jgi:hypothetical protein